MTRVGAFRCCLTKPTNKKDKFMNFNAILETNNEIAKITLSGELDASTAPEFKAKIEEAASQKLKQLVLMMQDLEYMASAGLRVLIFAKQKIGANVDIYAIAPQELVLDTIKKTGFHHSIIIQDSYDDAVTT
jgi:anti-anti-sigma factor